MSRVEYKGQHILLVDVSEDLPRRGAWPLRQQKIQSITVHHTGGSAKLTGFDAVQNTAEFAVRDDDPETPGLEGRGWPGCPYTFFIPYAPLDPEGLLEIYRTASDEEMTYHAGGWNDESTSIGLQGTFASRHALFGGQPSHEQLLALSELLDYLLDRFGLEPHEVWPHAWRGKPSCPGDTVINRILDRRHTWESLHGGPLARTRDELRERLAQALGLAVSQFEDDATGGYALRRLIERFQASQTVLSANGKRYPALAVDGIYGPATETMLRRELRARGVL